MAGGGAANLPVRVSALVRSKYLQFADYDMFSFTPPRHKGAINAQSDDEEASAGQDARVVADKLPLTLDQTAPARSPSTTCPSPAARVNCCWKPPTPTQRRSANPAQHPHAVACGRGGGHQDRGLGIGQPEDPLPGPGAAAQQPGGAQCSAAGAGHCAHHHHHAQAHGGRLLQLRQPDIHQRPGHGVHRQERQPGPAAVRRQAGRGR